MISSKLVDVSCVLDVYSHFTTPAEATVLNVLRGHAIPKHHIEHLLPWRSKKNAPHLFAVFSDRATTLAAKECLTKTGWQCVALSGQYEVTRLEQALQEVRASTSSNAREESEYGEDDAQSERGRSWYDRRSPSSSHASSAQASSRLRFRSRSRSGSRFRSRSHSPHTAVTAYSSIRADPPLGVGHRSSPPPPHYSPYVSPIDALNPRAPPEPPATRASSSSRGMDTETLEGSLSRPHSRVRIPAYTHPRDSLSPPPARHSTQKRKIGETEEEDFIPIVTERHQQFYRPPDRHGQSDHDHPPPGPRPGDVLIKREENDMPLRSNSRAESMTSRQSYSSRSRRLDGESHDHHSHSRSHSRSPARARGRSRTRDYDRSGASSREPRSEPSTLASTASASLAASSASTSTSAPHILSRLRVLEAENDYLRTMERETFSRLQSVLRENEELRRENSALRRGLGD
ncbi:hypothetical protein BOTBODRAFT_67802 [Botryobasidium botryosum FD-172 SS1]|uniref:Uncharacterized protein n=1 Tax=Botryobasidium botryosum (strain FD-172 SS1) TaxID=930990 RepID=A0A067M7P9_BOTB1|nr:hypothetical protein BOTBODRAFT_67802 [Botryobasidium botryosum FD-172 SS1]